MQLNSAFEDSVACCADPPTWCATGCSTEGPWSHSSLAVYRRRPNRGACEAPTVHCSVVCRMLKILLYVVCWLFIGNDPTEGSSGSHSNSGLQASSSSGLHPETSLVITICRCSWWWWQWWWWWWSRDQPCCYKNPTQLSNTRDSYIWTFGSRGWFLNVSPRPVGLIHLFKRHSIYLSTEFDSMTQVQPSLNIF